MIEFRGFFKDINDNDVVVEITKQSDENLSFTIGEDGIYFAGNSPVTITQDIENEFQIILSKQCTINLITEEFMGDYLFADNARDVEVTVQRYINQGNQTRRFVLFNGFLEPITFSQPFSKVLNSFTLTANDYLGTLQYLNYKNITLTDFDDSKQDAANRSFKDILYEIIPSARIWYDQSKGIDENSIQNIFDDLGVFDIYMIGETADDLWTQEEVIQEMLRYLNLHIVMNGSDFYIFDWDSMMAGQTINWLNLGTKRIKRGTYQEITLTKEYYADDDTNVTVSDVFNQIQVTDELESLEDLIKSPLDNDSLQPLYPRKSWYMTEYISGINDRKDRVEAKEAWETLLHNGNTNFYGIQKNTWFIQPMYNPDWKLNLGDGRTIEDLVERDENNLPINAYKLPLYANTHRFTPLIMQCGFTKQRPETNNSPIAKVEMDPYLFISIKGNDADPSTNANAMKPSPGDEQDYQDFQDHSPILEYVSKISGGTFSPVDESTTNYIVFSGKILLQPVVWECDRYLGAVFHQECRDPQYIDIQPFTTASRAYDGDGGFWHVDYSWVQSTEFEKDRYYTRRFYKDVSTNTLSWDECLVNEIDPETGWNQPFDYRLAYANLHMPTDDKGKKMLEYKYTVIGDKRNSPDLIKKLPILECSLVIGDKCLVEYDMDIYGGSKFIWVDKNVGYPQTYIDENDQEVTYYKKTFSLGIDPDTDNLEDPDCIIGQEYNFQNTVDMFTMDLNGPEGTAIPINRSDALAGKVEFKILGPINLTYDEITRRNGDFWYWHTRWYTTSRAVLSHLESIIIKDFEAKLYTSGASDAPDSDLIYVSNETDRYVSKNDETTFKFITQLSSQECLQKGIKPSINQNAVLNIRTNLPVSSIYNRLTDETAKAEEHFVDQYYRIFSKPKVMMQTTIHDGLGVDFESMCDTDYMEKPSYILGIDQDLKMATMTIKIKEI